MCLCAEKRGEEGRKETPDGKKYEISILGDGTETGIPCAVIVGNIFVRGFIYLFFFFLARSDTVVEEGKKTKQKRKGTRVGVYFLFPYRRRWRRTSLPPAHHRTEPASAISPAFVLLHEQTHMSHKTTRSDFFLLFIIILPSSPSVRTRIYVYTSIRETS